MASNIYPISINIYPISTSIMNAFSYQSLYKMLEGMGQRPSGDPKARARFVKIIKFGLGLVGWIC